jgi:hypothetical protein
MPDRYRVLITASRSWTDRYKILVNLLEIWHDAEEGGLKVTWVHGDCKEGGDALADEILRQFGRVVERHPADWDVCAGSKCTPTHRKKKRWGGGTYCPTAGLDRDEHMVSLGADLVLAFINPCTDPKCKRKRAHGSHGASETARMADEAGIEVRVIEP